MHRNKNAGLKSPDALELVRAVRAFRGTEDALAFVRELLTPAEIEDFSLRWRLLKMLEGGAPQRKIAAALGISLCKITRGSRVLKKRGSMIKRALTEKYHENGKTTGTAG